MPVSKHEEAELIIRKEPITDCYEIGGELGRGKFAVVKRCVDRTSGRCYAAKYLRKNRRSGSGRADIMKEIDIMRLTKDQPRIIQMREVFESQREMIIVLELAAGGELFRRIAEEPLTEEDTQRVVRQILEGVVYLHEMEIIHMDLKPENILLCTKGALELKVADFGLSIQLQPGEMLRNLVGTAEYVAPEILNYEPVSCASDMWSVGALTYALMAGYSPFQGETNQETFLNVSMVDYSFDDEMFDCVSDMSKDFIEKLLVKTPKRRITARECLAHPWMSDVTITQPIRSHYESSTSVDSSISLSMDNMVSSNETSPISSTTSSFAAGQGSFDTNLSTPLEECTTVGEGKDSGIGHRMSPSQLSTSLTQGLGAALVSSARINTSFDGPSTQSRSSSSEWLGRQRELSSSPSWGERSGRSPSIESSTSGNGTAGDDLVPVKQVSASSSHQDDDTTTPIVELGGKLPISQGESVLTEVESVVEYVGQPQLHNTPQLLSADSGPVARSEKEVSPEVNKADEVMRLLRDGLSLSNGGSEGGTPSVTSASSCSRIEHRRLYTGSGGGALTGSRPASSASLQAGHSPARDVSLSRSSPAGIQQGLSEVMHLLTVGVPLTDGEEGAGRGQGPVASGGGSRNAEKPAESDVLKLLRVGITPDSVQWKQKSESSGLTSQPQLRSSPQRRRLGKARPDSFILPLEVQEAILKGGELDLTKIEEAEEGECHSPEKSKGLGAMATKQHRTAWN